MLAAAPEYRPPAPPKAGQLTELERRVLSEIQDTLLEHGVRAEPMELRTAMIEEMFSRPELCRGLVASYLMGRGN